MPQPPSLDLRHFRSPLANIPGLVEEDDEGLIDEMELEEVEDGQVKGSK